LNEYRLLAEFRNLFNEKQYRHRDASLGNYVAMHLFEDLVTAGRSAKLVAAIQAKQLVLNVQNTRRGIEARRGDGTLGELIHGTEPVADPGYAVARGPIATASIGVEMKILAKAMIKQIDRVINDLRNQVDQFRKGGSNPISVAIVGINYADRYTSYEGDRAFPTTGRGGYLHPIQEAQTAEKRLLAEAKPSYDEFLILRFKATNEPPFPFEWLDLPNTTLDYAAILTRLSSKYQQRF
jgi:hypothetical protein